MPTPAGGSEFGSADPSGAAPGSTHSELSGAAGNVVQAREVSGGVHFHQDGAPRRPVPRQLPGDVRGFVNRTRDLERLDEITAADCTEPGVTALAVIAGTAGVGKTSLALRWAHREQHRFPDGQLYVNLRGYDPGKPVTPQHALDCFLEALDVPPRAIPRKLPDKAAAYRSLLAGRRILVVLDNAAGVSQVRPLLPGSGGCQVLVTSRSRLSGLAAREGARRITLDVLSEDEAVRLVREVTAGQRPDDEPAALAELARLCAHLPLALRIAAERASARPWMRLTDLIRDLRDESVLWDALTVDDGEEADAVRTVFAWSYRALPPEEARLFRLLGLHPGPDFGAGVAATLAGVTLARARTLLDVLIGAHLIEQHEADRYHFHDLLRTYARDQACHEEAPELRNGLLRRVLNWYGHTADAAQTWINPHEPHVELDAPEEGVVPLVFSGHDEAVAWYEAERAGLPAIILAAVDAGLDRPAWQLAVVLRAIHMRLQPFDEWIAIADAGLVAARRSGDRAAEAEVLESLGMAYAQRGQAVEAADFHRNCLTIRQELLDPRGVAFALNNLAVLGLRTLDSAAALLWARRAAEAFEAIGEWHWARISRVNLAEAYCEAEEFGSAVALVSEVLPELREPASAGHRGNALNVLSTARLGLGDAESARAAAAAAVEVATSRHNRVWEGHWLCTLGRAQQACGDIDEALASYRRSAALQHGLGDRVREARAWHLTGVAYQALGRHREAVDFHLTAAAVFRELDDGRRLAVVLADLAEARSCSGEHDAGAAARREAVGILARYDDVRASRLRERQARILGD
ncbi:ATP-binding protein [Embleya sp. NPDC127516]|uniref:ATP-binding protein n=1 Tax=Embleya sp. NPDC127516 TaxID=3363990 RepID=UPI00382C44AF